MRRNRQQVVPGRFGSVAELLEWLERVRKNKNWSDWHWQVRNSLGAVDLARLGLLQQPDAAEAALRYAVGVTPYYLAIGDLTNEKDPVVRQWLPCGEECALANGGVRDPFGEAGSTPLPGVVHRFADRVLVMTSDRCAVRCRHCTRKNAMDGLPLTHSVAELQAAVDYVSAHSKVREVILSGGDPLLDGDSSVLRFVRAFAALPQIDAVRIGTRVLSTLPMRITQGLAVALGESGKVWVNTQFNHEAELTAEAAVACRRLVEAGVPVSNQSVLLRGINDSLAALEGLCCGLQRIRVRPYYVFIGDPVMGTEHLRVSATRAAKLAKELAQRIGGLAMPRFVADIPGAPSKTDVGELVRCS